MKSAKSFSSALRKCKCKTYAEYRQRKHWRRLRSRRLRKAECCACGATGARLILHHVEYGRLGNERDCDLIVMCQDCHGKIHAELDARFPETDVFVKVRRTREIFSEVFGVEYPAPPAPREQPAIVQVPRPSRKAEGRVKRASVIRKRVIADAHDRRPRTAVKPWEPAAIAVDVNMMKLAIRLKLKAREARMA